MYFAAFSHNVINCTLNLSNDLKMGEYRTIIFLFHCYLCKLQERLTHISP